MSQKPKVIFVITEDWAFLSHRLPMARAARNMGCQVIVAARDNGNRRKIEEEGFRFCPIPMQRRSLNPFAELRTVYALARLFYGERPDIVHNVALKPILDGSLAARIAPVDYVINTFAGMGAIFIGEQRTGLRALLIQAFRWLMRARNVRVIVQNEDDMEMLDRLGITTKERTVLIRGSGVDMGIYARAPEPAAVPAAVMVSRILWDKGVGEFVEAARLLRSRGVAVRMVLAGTPDTANPRSVPEHLVRQWREEGVIEWEGQCTDVSGLWAESHIAVLPSYREGTPKSLLEAAAAGRPIITTDVPGCRQLVDDGVSGILVPAGSAEALADAVARLAASPELRASMGEAARRRVEERYSSTVVEAALKDLYAGLLKRAAG